MGLAVKNNNPGNLKDPETGDFMKFNSPEEGYTALMNDLQKKVSGVSKTGLHGGSTLYEFASKYAPSNDNNNVAQYTANLANFLKVRPDTKLSELHSRIPEFANAIATNEDREFVKMHPLKVGGATSQSKNEVPTVSENPSSVASNTYDPTATTQVAEPTEKPGFFRGLAQDIANPLESIGQGVLNQFRKLGIGDLQNGGVQTQSQGLFGQTVDPTGYRGGQELSTGETAKQFAGNLAQGVATVGIPGMGAEVALAKGILPKVYQGLKLGSKLGALQGGGSSLAKGDSYEQALGEAASGAIMGGLSGGAIGGIGGVISALPRRLIQSAFGDITPETAQFALNKKMGTIGGMIKNSESELNILGNKVDKMLGQADNFGKSIEGFDIYKRAIKGNPDIPGSGLGDSGYSITDLAKITRNLVKNQGQLVNDLFSGDLSLRDANKLKTALGKSLRWRLGESTIESANKAAGKQVYFALSSAIKQKAPGTDKLFRQMEKEIELSDLLSKMQKKGILGDNVTVKDLLVGMGAATAGGVPGLLSAGAYHVGTTPLSMITAAKVLNKTNKAAGRAAYTGLGLFGAGMLNRAGQQSNKTKAKKE